MLITVGSTNEAKVQAVKELLIESPTFSHSQVQAVSTSSGVSNQPLSLQETTQGAKNRAKNAFSSLACNYGVGIESGLMEAHNTQTGFLHVCICSIFDGERFYTGLSTGFELPHKILRLIIDEKMDLTQACLHSGISANKNLGSQEGMIGILTKGRIDRKEYSKQCVIAALLQLENAPWYTT